MSGGHFDYDQYRIKNMAEEIESIIEKVNMPIPKKDKDPWDTRDVYYDFTDETVKEFKRAVHYLRMAEIYTTRVDYLMSGDDGEESFHRRLKEELEIVDFAFQKKDLYSIDDINTMINAVNNPPQPNDALKTAAENYNNKK